MKVSRSHYRDTASRILEKIKIIRTAKTQRTPAQVKERIRPDDTQK